MLEPARPVIAAARRDGLLDGAHVAVMLRAFRELPANLPVEDQNAAEAILVDAARVLDANDLSRVARALVDAADPSGGPPADEGVAGGGGPEPDDDVLDPRRDLTIVRRRDGWGRLSGLLDPAATPMLDAWLAARSTPRPEDETGRDSRTPGQRRHDALVDLLGLALRADEYGTATGSPVTIHLSMTGEQFETGTGHAVTSLGQRIRISTALRLAGQACIAWAVHNGKGSILQHGRALRLATRAQAEALLVRDAGCAFPGCDTPPEWCDRHHVQEWQTGGRTDIDNLTLLCRYHHSRFAQQGWEIVMRSGVPWFIPPKLIDPDQKPLRNIRGLGVDPFHRRT